MFTMIDKITTALKQHCRVGQGVHITLALSGGKDSIVLGTVLLSLQGKLNLSLSAVHIHHGLRSASDEEEQFVRRWCAENDLPLEVHHLNLTEHKGASMEMAARQARYDIFQKYIRPDHFVATAHHLGDCMETFFINLCRGCGSRGLASIPYARDGIIRPMLDITPDEIAAFAQENGLEWREDESNQDTYYLRNFIRHEILPRLHARQDICFEKNFATTLQNLRQEADLLDSLSETDTNDVATLLTLPRPILWRVLKARCPALSRERFERIAQRLGESHFKEQIEGDLYCLVQQGKLTFEKQNSFAPIAKTPLTSPLILQNKIVQVKEIHSQFTHFDIDCDTINTTLFVRTRLQGDRFAPRGMLGSKTVGKLMSERHIADRDNRLLITDENDRIIYIEGFGADRHHAAGKHTKKALRITIKENNNEVT